MSPAPSLQTESNGEDDQLEISRYQKGVRHLCERGIARVPTKYILPISDRPMLAGHNADDIGLKLPVIDFARLQDSCTRFHEVQSLAKACEDYGFFQVGGSNSLALS
ncbi:hypothetical protein U1Q18_021921 [Sarracenia purpurea var. burkii]